MQKRIIATANAISERMRTETEDNGVLSRSIDTNVCNKVYDYAKKFTNITIGTKLEFFTDLYNHPNYGFTGTGIYRGSGVDRVRIENEILRKRARALFLFGKFLGGRLIEIMEDATERKANEMTVNLVLYAGSRTSKSSPHFKASDRSSF